MEGDDEQDPLVDGARAARRTHHARSAAGRTRPLPSDCSSRQHQPSHCPPCVPQNTCKKPSYSARGWPATVPRKTFCALEPTRKEPTPLSTRPSRICRRSIASCGKVHKILYPLPVRFKRSWRCRLKPVCPSAFPCNRCCVSARARSAPSRLSSKLPTRRLADMRDKIESLAQSRDLRNEFQPHGLNAGLTGAELQFDLLCNSALASHRKDLEGTGAAGEASRPAIRSLSASTTAA